jgi:hypothetical protein
VDVRPPPAEVQLEHAAVIELEHVGCRAHATIDILGEPEHIASAELLVR